jgi:hypothetical protein
MAVAGSTVTTNAAGNSIVSAATVLRRRTVEIEGLRIMEGSGFKIGSWICRRLNAVVTLRGHRRDRK